MQSCNAPVFAIAAFFTFLAPLVSGTALRANRRARSSGSVECIEYLWTGHANTSTIGTGVIQDLKYFASAAHSFSGRGHFAYYVDTPQGLEVGVVNRAQSEPPVEAQSSGSSLADSAATLRSPSQWSPDLAGTDYFPSVKDAGFPAVFQAAGSQMAPKDRMCLRIATYSGHGYNFNGIGYQDHHFVPWQGFFDSVVNTFGGPVDLLGLDTCRMANYMMLGEMQGSANLVLAHQHVDLYSPQFGSWSYDKLPLDAQDAEDFAKRVMHDTFQRGDRAGMSLIDMQRFQTFSSKFEKLLDALEPRLADEFDHVRQARRKSFELDGPSLYEPDNGGMIVDLESFLSAFSDSLQSESPGHAGLKGLIKDTIQAKRDAVLVEEHDASLPGLSGMSLWFMKPDTSGWHHDLLGRIRQSLTRTGGGRWATFLEAYYTQADHANLSDEDKHKRSAKPQTSLVTNKLETRKGTVGSDVFKGFVSSD